MAAKKPDRIELEQLQVALTSLAAALSSGVDHLDTLTSRAVSRVLGELVQEVRQLPATAGPDDIATLVHDVLHGTTDLQRQLRRRWSEELAEPMARAVTRAEALDHHLADFTCLTVDGQTWGAVCVKCLRWVTVTPDGSGGALLNRCPGWQVSWKQ